MPYWAWSYLLTVVGVSGLWLAGRGRAIGWRVGLLAQALWATYAITTRQYGFLVSALAYGWVYLVNLVRWGREKERVMGFQKHGTGEILREEGIQTQAARTAADLDALKQENVEFDGESEG